MKKLSLASLIFIATIVNFGCATTKDDVAPSGEAEVLFPELKERRPYGRDETVAEIIDYDGLQRSLRLERGFSEYGYVEREFATCDVGFGYSSTHRCRKNVFVVLQFQLLCRPSEGTVSETLRFDDMAPLASRIARWDLAGYQGSLVLDSQGRGQVRAVFPSSPREKRLKISVQNDFLYLQASTLKRVITPSNWCR